MPVAWIPIDGGISACHKMRKKKYVYWRFIKMCVGTIQLGILADFGTENCIWIFLIFTTEAFWSREIYIIYTYTLGSIRTDWHMKA